MNQPAKSWVFSKASCTSGTIAVYFRKIFEYERLSQVKKQKNVINKNIFLALLENRGINWLTHSLKCSIQW